MRKFTLIATRTVDLLKSIIGIISIVYLIGAVSLFLFCLTFAEYYYQIRPFGAETIQVDNENSVYHTNLLVVGSGRALYKQWIENEHGEQVYQYPDYKIRNGFETHAYQETLYIPRLPKGRYAIKAHLFYRPNPISHSDVVVTIGTFVIE